MAIDRTGITSLDAGAGDITYTGNEGPRSPQQIAGGEYNRVLELLEKVREDIPLSEEEKIELQGLIRTLTAKGINVEQLIRSASGEMRTASAADPMLQEEYNKYVFEMQELGREPMSIEQFKQQAVSGMAQGGRAGYQSGKLVAPPGISQEEWEKLFGIKGPRPLSSQSPYLSVHAYGGMANPTYTQKRKQSLAYGGIAGLKNRPGYFLGDLVDWAGEKAEDVYKKVRDDLIPNEIKENPLLSSVVAGTLLNQYGVPFTGTPGDRMGQDWFSDLITGGEGTISNNPAWGGIGSGAGYFKGDNGTTGSSAGDIFRINELALDANVTITATENASATGPLTVSSSYTLTVEGTLVII